MSKPFTEADFLAQITEDRSWRMREILDLKAAIVRADKLLQRVLLRALVTICYAHWEGYVRFSARKYLEHVALRKWSYGQLDQQFVRNYFLPRLGGLASSRSSVEARCLLVDEILSSSNLRFSHVNDDLVNTRSNLSFEVFADICLVCGVASNNFVTWNNFIDKFLLKRRNAIAHGEETFLAIDDLDEMTTQTIAVIRAFGDALENHVVLRKYRIG